MIEKEELYKANIEIEKQVSSKMNDLIYLEAKRKGLDPSQIVFDKKTGDSLRLLIREKLMSNHPVYKNIIKDISNNSNNEVKTENKVVEKPKPKPSNIKTREEAVEQMKQTVAIETALARRYRRKREKEEKIEGRIKVSRKKIEYVQNAMKKELEREKLERQKFVQASRENKVFSDDSIRKREGTYSTTKYWIFEEEEYLLELKNKGVAIKDIAYLLGRGIMQVSFKLTELKKTNKTGR